MLPIVRFRLAAVALVTAAVLASAPLIARDDKKDEFPNATREAPRTSTSNAVDGIQKAYDHLAEGRNDEAKALLEKALANTRATKYEQALALQGLSQIAYDADDVSGAIDFNQRAIALDALDNQAQFNLIYQQAQLNLMEENYEAALTAIADWFQLSGNRTPEALALKGNAEYRLERYDAAIQTMTEAISLSPEPDGSWYQLLIAAYTDADRGAEAAQMIEGLLVKDPDNKGLAQQAANLYLDLEQHDKATTVLRSAYDRGLLTEQADLKSLWQLYAFAGKPDEAAMVINAGIDKGIVTPDHAVWKSLGDAYASAEQWPKAIEYYTKAAPTAPDGQLDFLRGQLMIQETDQLADGKAAVQKAIARGGLEREGDAWILVGMAENELGNTDAAVAAYRKAATFESSRKMAEGWLKSIQR